MNFLGGNKGAMIPFYIITLIIQTHMWGGSSPRVIIGKYDIISRASHESGLDWLTGHTGSSDQIAFLES